MKTRSETAIESSPPAKVIAWPTSGGSYIKNADGSVTKVEGGTDPAEAAAEAPASVPEAAAPIPEGA